MLQSIACIQDHEATPVFGDPNTSTNEIRHELEAGALYPAVEDTYRIAPGMKAALDELPHWMNSCIRTIPDTITAE